MNIKSKNSNSPTTIEVGNKMITDTAIICDHFNDYFSNIILKTNKQPVLKTFDKFLNNPLSNSFLFEPCDPGEVMNSTPVKHLDWMESLQIFCK